MEIRCGTILLPVYLSFRTPGSVRVGKEPGLPRPRDIFDMSTGFCLFLNRPLGQYPVSLLLE
jgi:hypothetical protein